MGIISLIKDLILHLLIITFISLVFILVGIVILFMFMWDYLIFIVKNIGELLWQKKQ